MAAHDLRGEPGLHVGQVEDAGLGGELGVENDLEEQVAELIGEGGRRAVGQRIVDLVRLLQEVAPERLVGLLPVPRAAVRGTQAVADPGHRPRRRDGELRLDRRQVERAAEVGFGQLPDRRRLRRAVPPDRVVGRVEPPQDVQRGAAGRPVPARERARGGAFLGAANAE